jgi:glycerophosphoryl diester phosphodiesterase
MGWQVKKLIVAHRGGSSQWHENTSAAIQDAIACRADMVEFDIRRTADGEFILHHDECLGDRRLMEMDYEEANSRAAILGYRIPRLSEILDLAKGRILLDLELKEAGYEEAVLRMVFDQHFDVSEFAVTSFEPGVIERIKRSCLNVNSGLLVYGGTGHQALEAFQRTGADFLGPDYELLDAATLDYAHRSAITLIPWTVNDPAAIRALLSSAAVGGIITDQIVNALRIRDDLGSTDRQ